MAWRRILYLSHYGPAFVPDKIACPPTVRVSSGSLTRRDSNWGTGLQLSESRQEVAKGGRCPTAHRPLHTAAITGKFFSRPSKIVIALTRTVRDSTNAQNQNTHIKCSLFAPGATSTRAGLYDSQVIHFSDRLWIASEIIFAMARDACSDGCNSSYLLRNLPYQPLINETPARES